MSNCNIVGKHPIVEKVKKFIREPYLCPGGYPKALIMTDRQVMCVRCAKENFRLIASATRDLARNSGWGAIGVDVLWEGPSNYCANCNEEMPTAFGDRYEEEQDDA